MKRRLSSFFRFLVAWGMSHPGGMWHPDMNALLGFTEVHPPLYGPERLVEPILTQEELELWRCLQGKHGAECGSGSGHR